MIHYHYKKDNAWAMGMCTGFDKLADATQYFCDGNNM
jgi:hypothetical protein